MSKKFLWIVTFMFSLMVAQLAYADTSLCRESLSKMVQSLNLDEAQKAKIKPIIDQMKTNMKTAASQMEGLESQLKEQVNSPTMDQSKVDSIVDQKTKLVGDMMKARISATNQIYAILNPQQKEKLQGFLKKADEKIAAAFKKCGED